MILDTSAVIAVMQAEGQKEELLAKMLRARTLAMGAPSLAETAVVLSARLNRDAQGLLARFVSELEIITISFGDEHWKAASDAYCRFGKGRHKAKLNFGDCMAYAVASVSGQPLLFVGDDFRHTDILAA